jgi:hypothetical protein
MLTVSPTLLSYAPSDVDPATAGHHRRDGDGVLTRPEISSHGSEAERVASTGSHGYHGIITVASARGQGAQLPQVDLAGAAE